jgi:hypothetical protein
MHPFAERRANGELRRRPKVVAPKKGRSRSTNKILVLPRGVPDGTQARRFRDLVRSALDGFENPDQAAINIARSIALASVRLDQIQAQMFGDGEVDDMRLARLAGIVSRGQQRLKEMRAPSSAPAAAEAAAADGMAELKRHLDRLAREG